MADALVHDPDILILDEPTAGLDPIQNREVRALIRELGEQHTILLSTHILPEVEAICGRVLMIAGGRIAVDEKLDRLRAESSIWVEVHGPLEKVRRMLETTPGVAKVMVRESSVEKSEFELLAKPGDDPREAIAQRVVSNGWGLRRLDARRSSLEERFILAVRESTLAAGPQPEAA